MPEGRGSFAERLMGLKFIKAWSAIIVAIIALVSTILVARMQSQSASSSSLAYMVKQVNEDILPRIEAQLEKMEDRLDVMSERIAKLEGKSEQRARYLSRIVDNGAGMIRALVEPAPAKPASLPRLKSESDVKAEELK